MKLLDGIPFSSANQEFAFTCPPITAEMLDVRRGSVIVVRDDLLPGGTKQRAALPYLASMMERGIHTFAYASPFAGYAQLALANAAHALGAQARLFCEADPFASSELKLEPHAFTKAASNLGAEVELFATLSEAHEASVQFAEGMDETFNIPLGFDDVRFRDRMSSAVATEWKWLRETSNLPIRRVWVACGSGTLARVLSEVVGPNVTVRAVDVGVLPMSDSRIESLRKIPNVEYQRLEEAFADRAAAPPPIPSNVHYDAKLWRHLSANANAYDVWWNVAQ